MSKKYTKRELECGHVRWFKQNPPSIRESIWCFDCKDYVKTTKAVMDEAPTVWPEGYTTERIGGKIYVTCIRDECGESWEAANNVAAERTAFVHIATKHGKSTLIGTPLPPPKRITEPDF